MFEKVGEWLFQIEDTFLIIKWGNFYEVWNLFYYKVWPCNKYYTYVIR